jgi:hypothetical protein
MRANTHVRLYLKCLHGGSEGEHYLLPAVSSQWQLFQRSSSCHMTAYRRTYVPRMWNDFLLHMLQYNLFLQNHGPCPGSGGWSPASHLGYPRSISCQPISNLWWTNWNWDRLFLRIIRPSPASVISPYSVLIHSAVTDHVLSSNLQRC